MSEIKPLIVEPKSSSHKGSVIWLHGFGGSADNFYSFLNNLEFKTKNDIRWIFPNAPLRVVDNMGQRMQSWFDINNLSCERDSVSWFDVEKSVVVIENMVNKERSSAQLPICLAGFSQGGLIALHTAMKLMQSNVDNIGVMVLSSFYPNLENKLARLKQIITEAELNDAHKRKNYPIFIMHGVEDEILSISTARRMYKLFLQKQELPFNVIWKEYPMAHELCADQAKDISNFLSEFFAQ